jgi:hypothetical protein
MPILQHSQAHLPPVPAPPYDSKRKHKEVWYLRSTNEIFTDYEYVNQKKFTRSSTILPLSNISARTYIERLMQYRLPQWQCERTGRADFTFDQALESENAEDSRAEYRFSFSLARRVFQCVQFGKVFALFTISTVGPPVLISFAYRNVKARHSC